MTFGLSAGAIAGISAGVAAVGTGLSAASAAGAFNGPVDNWEPTPEELEAAQAARDVYGLGRRIQNPLDRLARKDIAYLQSPEYYQQQADLAVNPVVGQLSPQIQQGLQATAMRTGGPGSGAWWNQNGQGSAMLDAARRAAAAQGRLGGINNGLTRTGQYLGRKTNDLQMGLQTMTGGGQQAAQALANRIQGQVANNIATSQAMGQLGGAMIGAGMSGLSMGAGMAGGAAGGLGTLEGIGNYGRIGSLYPGQSL